MATLGTELSVLVTLATEFQQRASRSSMHGYSKIFVQTICVSTVLHFGGKNSFFYGSASTVLHFGGENSSYSYCYSMCTGNGGVSGSTGVDERRGGLPSLPADQSR